MSDYTCPRCRSETYLVHLGRPSRGEFADVPGSFTKCVNLSCDWIGDFEPLTPRYCEDCRHYEESERDSRCGHPGAKLFGFVTREGSKPACISERTLGNCGHDGKHWEAKDADAD